MYVVHAEATRYIQPATVSESLADARGRHHPVEGRLVGDGSTARIQSEPGAPRPAAGQFRTAASGIDEKTLLASIHVISSVIICHMPSRSVALFVGPGGAGGPLPLGHWLAAHRLSGPFPPSRIGRMPRPFPLTHAPAP